MTPPDVRIFDDPARACARSIERRLRAAARRRADGPLTLAVSGGSSAPAMFEVLAVADLPWKRITIWQVDERVAPDGHHDRNATQLGALPGRHRVMPVTDDQLTKAARRYARGLPERFDVVHLGMGGDGHTASWPPGDPVIDADADVALSGEYQGRVRMTLTPLPINRAVGRVVLAAGEEKARALRDWVQERHDPTPPIARLRSRGTVVFTDSEGASLL